MAEKKKAYDLSDVKVKEISIVEKPAVGDSRFVLIKRDDMDITPEEYVSSQLLEISKALAELQDAPEGVSDIAKKLEDMASGDSDIEKAGKALSKKNMKLLEEAKKAINRIMEEAGTSKPDGEDDEKGKDKEKMESEHDDKTNGDGKPGDKPVKKSLFGEAIELFEKSRKAKEADQETRMAASFQKTMESVFNKLESIESDNLKLSERLDKVTGKID